MYDYTKVNYIGANQKVIIICKKHGEFEQTPSKHINNKHGCLKCCKTHSLAQIEWLNFIESKDNIYIQHIGNSNEFIIPTTNYKADGYCKETNTVYEYHGDFWHGNPKIYKSENLNKKTGSTFGFLYQKTLTRENLIKSLGFNLVTIWKKDWNNIKKSVIFIQRKFRKK